MHNNNKRNRNVNKHHFWWERNWYHGRDKALRQLGGFVVPATLYTHQLLHAQMRPPVKPFAKLRDGIIDYTMSLPAENEDRFSIPNEVADWLEQQSEQKDGTEYGYRAYRLSAHIRQQIGYLGLESI